MSWTGSTPEQMGARKGREDALAGKPMKPDIHWPRSVRDSYRDSYNRTHGTRDPSGKKGKR